MSEARLVARNTGALAAAQIIERVANAILLFILARTLGPAGLGVYSGALAYYALIAVGGELGATTYLVREVSREPSKASEFLIHLGAMAATAGAALAALVIAIVPFLGLSSTLAAGTTLVMLAVVPGALNVMQEGVFIAYQRAHIRTVVTFVGALFNVCTTIAVLASGGTVVQALAIFVITQYLVTGALFWAINRWLTPIRGRFHLRTARRMLRAMRVFIGSSLLGTLFSRPEIIILTLVASEAQVGYYAGALKLVDLFAFVPATFAMSLFPLLSRAHLDGRARMQAIQDKALRFLAIVTLPISAATLALGPELVSFAYGADFGPAVPVLRLLSFSLCLNGLFELFWRVLSARNQQSVVLGVQAITVLPRLGGGVALAIPFAAVGAAVSVMANVLLHVALLAIRVRRDGTRLNLVSASWRPAMAAGVMGVLAWLAVPHIGLIPTVAGAAGLYAALVLGVGALSIEEMRLILRRRVAA